MEGLSVDRPDSDPGPAERADRAAATSRSRFAPMARLVRAYRVFTRALHRTVLAAIAHDCLNIAQSAAYSAIVALFPALLVAAAVIGLLPDTTPVRFQLAAFFDRVLPPGVSPLLDAAFENTPAHTHTVRMLVSAGIVSVAGASNVIATLMEGLRRARQLPRDSWSFWQRRRRSLELVPLSLVPLFVASLLVVFGHAVTAWLATSIGPEVREPIYAITVLIRWSIALGASIGLIALLYHLGVPDGRMRGGGSSTLTVLRATRGWRATLPGAVMATAMWFLTTLAFGWYVTRFANYSEVYGSLGAGIALLFWLYIISLSVLCGAEFNAQFDSRSHAHFGPSRVAPMLPPDPGDASAAAELELEA